VPLTHCAFVVHFAHTFCEHSEDSHSMSRAHGAPFGSLQRPPPQAPVAHIG
jgi:hypothetical protein